MTFMIERSHLFFAQLALFTSVISMILRGLSRRMYAFHIDNFSYIEI